MAVKCLSSEEEARVKYLMEMKLKYEKTLDKISSELRKLIYKIEEGR